MLLNQFIELKILILAIENTAISVIRSAAGQLELDDLAIIQGVNEFRNQRSTCSGSSNLGS